MSRTIRTGWDPGRIVRRVRDALRGESPATFFDPLSRRDLARLLTPFGLPVPSNFEPPPDAFDRVRQVYELRYDVRDVFPLGLTPAGRGEYAAWLLRYGRSEYGFTADDVLGYLFALTADPACGLADTYLLAPEWQRAVPDAFTDRGWHDLKRWVAARYPERAGRWLRRAARPDRFAALAQLARPSDAGGGGCVGHAPRAVGAAARGACPTHPTRPPLPESASARLAVNVLGHFKYDSGLQEEAFQHVAALEAAGYRTHLRDVPVCYPRDWRDGGRFTDPELGGMTLIKTGAADPLDEVYRRAGLHPRPGVYRVACWSWELEAFPRHAVERGGLADEVWTPSEFCARSVRAAMPGKPVFAMPPAVTAPDFPPRPRSYFGLPDDRFLFLFAFDMASGMERKNPLGLIRAFRRAFRPDDRAHLALKVSRGQAHPREFAELRRAADEAGVTLLDRVMPRADVWALLACCDSYVSLHRAEGFGFTMAEAMSLGKPTVATGYSGNLDFMTAGNSYLVRSRPVALDRDHGPYPAGCVWADPCEEHAAELLRRVFEDRDEAAAVAARGRDTVTRFLSREAAARRITTRLAEIRHP